MASPVSGSYRAGLLAMRLPAARLTASVPASQTPIRRLAGLQPSIATTCILNYAPRREYYRPPWKAPHPAPWKSIGAKTRPWDGGPGGGKARKAIRLRRALRNLGKHGQPPPPAETDQLTTYQYKRWKVTQDTFDKDKVAYNHFSFKAEKLVTVKTDAGEIGYGANYITITPPGSGDEVDAKVKSGVEVESEVEAESGAEVETGPDAKAEARQKPLVSTLWLRDSCPCHLCVDPNSGQKNFSTTDLPETPRIDTAQLEDDGSLRVVWANDPVSGGSQHISVYPAATVKYLQKWDRAPMYQHSPGARLLWDRHMFEGFLAQGRAKIDYQDWMDGGDQFWRALNDLRELGLIFVRGVPSDEEAVERIAKQIGPLQETFYGRTWDVRSKPNAENVAYTSQFLGLHQDLLYYPDVPRLQLLHCLSNDAKGGESLFSNGARAAVEVHLATPWSHHKLKTHLVTHGYNKNGHDYTRMSPTILIPMDGSQSETRWSPPFQQPFRPPQRGEHVRAFIRWKRAAVRFKETAEAETNMFETKLQEGECVIFNNRYILHGRRAFAPGSQGGRWLKGTYINEYEYNRAMLRLDDHMRPKAIAGAWPKQGMDGRKFQLRERDIVQTSVDRRKYGGERVIPDSPFFEESDKVNPYPQYDLSQPLDDVRDPSTKASETLEETYESDEPTEPAGQHGGSRNVWNGNRA